MADKVPDRRTVFISYSNKDEVWKDRLVKHLAPLRQMGNLEVWDDRRIQPGKKWKDEIDRAIEQARVALLLVSPDWLASDWIQKVEAPQLLERAQRFGMALIPIILRPCPWQSVDWLSRIQAWPYHGKPLSSLRANAREASLADLARQILQLVGNASSEATAPNEPRVSISRFSITSQELLGREAELKALDDAWENPQIRVVNIMGMGGIGKTALVGFWLSRMARDRYRGAEQVFAWSFSDRPDSAEFLAEALRSFGELQAESPAAEERPARLVRRIRETRTLLIVDDLEGFTSPDKDHFLRGVSSGHHGLVILISRLTLAKDSETRRVLRLGGLAPDAGAALLRSLGVQGTEPDLAAACQELEGHPLALTLLGSALRQMHGGDIRQLGKLLGPGAAPNTQIVQRMLGEYEKSLETAELALLWVHTLFDRPMTREELAVLLSPPIPGLTDESLIQSKDGRSAAFDNLTALGVLSRTGSDAGGTSRIHALAREHFRNRLREERPEAYRKGHERLFRFLSSTVSGQPQSLEELRPLLSAVVHGCAAGLRGEALNLYRDRISRGDEQYLTRRLGAAEAEIKLLTPFFDQPWDRPGSDLADDDALLLLRAAGNALLAAGRPREAQTPFATLLERARSSATWALATWAARRLSEAQIFLGNLGPALVTAQDAVELSERSEDEGVRQAARIILADALHQTGRIQEARQMASKADLPSYRYLDLLLALGRFLPVLKQVSNQRMQAERSGDLVRMALSHLALGRAQIDEEGASSGDHLNQAVEILRRGGFFHWLPAALVARAALFLRRGRFDEAYTDLSQALEHASRCELRLHEADAWIGVTRLYLVTNPDRARQPLARARALVDETGYHRRDAELQELEQRLSAVAAVSTVDPIALAFRLVLAGHALPDLLLHPDLQKIEEAARRLSDEPGDPLLNAQRILEKQQPGIIPNPLWASWITVTQGGTLQRKNPA